METIPLEMNFDIQGSTSTLQLRKLRLEGFKPFFPRPCREQELETLIVRPCPGLWVINKGVGTLCHRLRSQSCWYTWKPWPGKAEAEF
jgi:hypothetical protein